MIRFLLGLRSKMHYSHAGDILECRCFQTTTAPVQETSTKAARAHEMSFCIPTPTPRETFGVIFRSVAIALLISLSSYVTIN